MPNGNPDFDLRFLEDFFEPIRESIERFARQHNLRLEKYYHELPSWDMTFRHPKGGIAQLDVRPAQEGVASAPGVPTPFGCSVYSSWWYDDYDRATRSIKLGPKVHLHRDPAAVAGELDKQLRLVLSWDFGQWDEIHRDAAGSSPRLTREQFDANEKRYPEVKP